MILPNPKLRKKGPVRPPKHKSNEMGGVCFFAFYFFFFFFFFENKNLIPLQLGMEFFLLSWNHLINPEFGHFWIFAY